jgi:3-oxoacyl-[acyl-carrier protein] reductase
LNDAQTTRDGDAEAEIHPDVVAGIALSGRVAVVTGAAGGIGKHAALLMAKAGATVVCSDLRSETLTDVVKQIENIGGAASAVAADVSLKEDLDALAAATDERFGGLDVWVNAAGILRQARMLDLTEESFRRTMAVNLEGTLWGSVAAARAMIPRRRGSIVNIASAGADFPGAGQVAYSASKSAVVQVTKTLAAEFGPMGIRANTVSPGWIETPMTSYHFTDEHGTVDDEKRRNTLAQFAKASPLGITGHPDDVAWTILFLASDASKFMTGQVLRPNGGIVMP